MPKIRLMKVPISSRRLQQLLRTTCQVAVFIGLGLASVIYAADGDNGRQHSLLPRPKAGSVSPIIPTQGVIVSGRYSASSGRGFNCTTASPFAFRISHAFSSAQAHEASRSRGRITQSLPTHDTNARHTTED